MGILKYLLTFVSRYIIIVSSYRKGGKQVAEKSRANYFKERRKNTKAFYVEIEKEKMDNFEIKLSNKNKTKKEWLNEKIDEELNN